MISIIISQITDFSHFAIFDQNLKNELILLINPKIRNEYLAVQKKILFETKMYEMFILVHYTL